MKNAGHIRWSAGLLTGVFLLFAGILSVAAEGKFLSAVDDLPLMAELNEIEGDLMVFDSSSGRIVEALTMGKVSKERVLKYYSETLPQLGWTETVPGEFSREGEVLTLEFPPTLALSGASPSGGEAVISVRFMISPIQ